MLSEQLNNVTKLFSPIPLEQMDRVKLMNRIDTKFAFTTSFLLEILPQLIDSYDVVEINERRTFNYFSQYFDDQKLSLYHDHHNGKTNRFKVRIRQYVESNLQYLEVKHKFKGRTVKNRMKLTSLIPSLSNEMLKFISENDVSNLSLVPSIANSFKRITLVNKTKNERLTFDFNLVFCKENDSFEYKNLVIAELKQEKLDRMSPFYVAMKNRLIRPYRLSKYCLGIMAFFKQEQVKINRFKRKFLQLQNIEKHAC